MDQSKRLSDFAKIKTDIAPPELNSGESFFIDGVEYEVIGIDPVSGNINARRVEIPFEND